MLGCLRGKIGRSKSAQSLLKLSTSRMNGPLVLLHHSPVSGILYGDRNGPMANYLTPPPSPTPFGSEICNGFYDARGRSEMDCGQCAGEWYIV